MFDDDVVDRSEALDYEESFVEEDDDPYEGFGDHLWDDECDF